MKENQQSTVGGTSVKRWFLYAEFHPVVVIEAVQDRENVKMDGAKMENVENMVLSKIDPTETFVIGTITMSVQVDGVCTMYALKN
jgi:hypothetical protein